MRHLVNRFLEHRWTEQDLVLCDAFFATHSIGFKPFPYPRELFAKFIRENSGYFPITVQALPEGTVAHIHVPVYQITASNEYSPLATFFETMLTHVWYPCCVATLSRKARDVVEEAFDRSCDEEDFFLIESRLHDFGFRGVTCVEQSIIGGVAHLLNFCGSDTMSAAYFAQYTLNYGKPIATSVPASEHSVMTSWPSEVQAFKHLTDKFGDGTISIVMDSYDYQQALDSIIPEIRDTIKMKNGFLVMRPDSGNPTQVVLAALQAGEKNFGVTVNKKGFKKVNNCAALQGDGIDLVVLREILSAVMAAGYSASSVLFGMGGGLLQRVNRDTMSFATKVCAITTNGKTRDVMKKPKTDPSKFSLPGKLAVKRVDGNLMVFPDNGTISAEENQLKVIYDHGPVPSAWREDFDTVRARVASQWRFAPRDFDPISPELRAKIDAWQPGPLTD